MHSRDKNSNNYERTEEKEQYDNSKRNENYSSCLATGETMGCHDREDVKHDLIDCESETHEATYYQPQNRDKAQDKADQRADHAEWHVKERVGNPILP